MADRDTRKKVLERLRQLQQARDEEKRGEKIGFSADLAQALYREMPEVLGSLAEAEEGRNTDKPWAAIARHETSLRNGVSRIFSLLHAHRAAGLMRG